MISFYNISIKSAIFGFLDQIDDLYQQICFAFSGFVWYFAYYCKIGKVMPV